MPHDGDYDEVDGEDEYEEYEDEGLEPVRFQAGDGHTSVLDAKDIAEQVERLNSWEEQLTTYSQELSERGWVSWKRTAVSSIMVELQRKMIPQQWKNHLKESEQRVAQLEDLLVQATQKERGLLQRIDHLQNGPGCAREVLEKLQKVITSHHHTRFCSFDSPPVPLFVGIRYSSKLWPSIHP